MRYRFIEKQRSAHTVRKLCQVMKVSRSGFYSWLLGRELPTARQRSDQLALVRIEKVLRESHYTYGVRRIHRKLPDLGKRRIWRLMRQNGLKVRTKQGWKPQTTAIFKFSVSAICAKRRVVVRAGGGCLSRVFVQQPPCERLGLDGRRGTC